MSQLIHGGDIYSAAKEYGVPLEQWLDLSTGINPDPYPVPKINAAYFQRLPYIEYELTNAIEHYYGIKGLACAGSQQAIGLLPRLLRSLQGNHKVLLPTQGYQEHRYSWQGTGAECEYYPSDNAAIARQTINKALAAAQQNDEPFYLVIINPNNPSGLCFTPDEIYHWSALMPKGGQIIVDEAFIDLHPKSSVLSDGQAFMQANNHNLVVLRSFGKFFGLAGIRLGFVFAIGRLASLLEREIGTWAVTGPAQAIAIDALYNTAWQIKARQRITANAKHTLGLLQPLFDKAGASVGVDSGLFITAKMQESVALQIYQQFAQRGVLLRLVQSKELGANLEAQRASGIADDICLLRSGLVSERCQRSTQLLAQCVREFSLDD